MSRRRATQSIVANPVLIGAVTVLVVVVAVYLSYNANSGLPFVPTYELKANVPNASKLVEGNEVREGGFRIGVVERIVNKRRPDGMVGAELTLKLDRQSGPLPTDSTVTIRPRSALGLKYVELTRGLSDQQLQNGSTITNGAESATVELEDFFAIFERSTRDDTQLNLDTFSGAFTVRGADLNRTIGRLPALLDVLTPVASNLASERTGLGFFLRELSDAARIVAPVSDSLAAAFTSGADVFEAFSRYPDALGDTISKSPATLDVGTRSLVAQRPFLRHLAGVSDELRGAAVQLRVSLPRVNAALASGTVALPRTVELNQRLDDSLRALDQLVSAPTTNLALRGLQGTVGTLNPQLRYLGPFVTVCNYWNYWWTYLADHLTDQDRTGHVERILVKTAPEQTDDLNTFGADNPANGKGADPISMAALGDPVNLHGQVYGAAVTADGRADCETGQRGYPKRLAENGDPEFDVAVDPHTPGAQGPTFTGRDRVPADQSWDRFPRAPKGVAVP